MLIVEVEGHRSPQPGERQLLGGSRGQVVTVDGLACGIQDELILLCTDHRIAGRVTWSA